MIEMRIVYKKDKNDEVVYRRVTGLNPKGWKSDPYPILEELNKPDGYEIREEGKGSSRRHK